jgi:hypothetical protein
MTLEEITYKIENNYKQIKYTKYLIKNQQYIKIFQTKLLKDTEKYIELTSLHYSVRNKINDINILIFNYEIDLYKLYEERQQFLIIQVNIIKEYNNT